MKIKTYVGKKPAVTQIKNLILEVVGEGKSIVTGEHLLKRNIMVTDWYCSETREKKIDGKVEFIVMEIRFTDLSIPNYPRKFRISSSEDLTYQLNRIY